MRRQALNGAALNVRSGTQGAGAAGRWLGFALVCALCLPDAFAVSTERYRLSMEGADIIVAYEGRVSAGIEEVFELLSDFERLDQLSAMIVSSEKFPASPDGRPTLKLELAGCVLGLCRHVTKVGRLTVGPGHQFVYELIPNRGSFEKGRESLRLESQGQSTTVSYHARFTPAFYLPPLIGRWLLGFFVREQIESTLRGIERKISSH